MVRSKEWAPIQLKLFFLTEAKQGGKPAQIVSVVTSCTMNRSPVLVDRALQRGGAHGAFTWGVLDRLLEEDWLRIEGISGTSAGAMRWP
jgi:predicted acylesterase/phospholipase RssA